MKVAFGTVVYKESFKYHQEFIESINNQDSNDFDIVLLNDNLNEEEFNKVSNSLQKKVITWYGKPNSLTSELRVQLIKNAKENGYDLLILGDFDDTFSRNRVSKIISEYEDAFSFYYNDLYYINTQRKFFHNLPQHIRRIDDIMECNFLGLSNTALNLKKIDYKLIDKLNEKNILVFDWYMYSILLKNTHIGKKIEDCKTYYRIHENNIAGENKDKIDDIKREINVKINHYMRLRRFDTQYNGLLDFYKRLKLEVDNGEILLLNYIDRDNEYWWGRLKSNKIRVEKNL